MVLITIDEEEQIQIDAIENEVESQVVEPSSKKTKRNTSFVWKHFTKIGVGDDGKEKAKCNACGIVYSCGSNAGTSHLKRHLPCKEDKNVEIGQMILDAQGKLKSTKIDNLVSRDLCATLLVKRDLPFNFVEYEELTNWLKYLNLDYTPISRNTAKADVVRIHLREKEKLKEQMAIIPSRISFTSDLWTSCTTEGYICLTAHYIDTNWILNSKVLNFRHIPPPHTGFELYKCVDELLRDWGIEKKVFSLTLDNSSANDVMQKTLKSQLVLQKALLSDGEFFHVRCSAHVLNLIVQEGLKVATDALHKIRESVKYVKGSETRMIKFQQCVKKIGDIDASSGLILDVPTRWNSTYLMLKSALKYERVFGNLHCDDENYKLSPSDQEWRRVEKMSTFLVPFYDMTNLISGTSYPTANMYFLQVWKIQCLLIENAKDKDDVIKGMAEKMMVKFQKYWEEYSVVLAFGAVLDPRMKLESLGVCYEVVDPLTWELKIKEVKKKMYHLFAQYSTTSSTPKAQKNNQASSSTSRSNPPSIFHELKIRRQHDASKTGKNQLDLYLDEPPLDIDFTEEMDILQWWKGNSQRFSDLSLMARDLLSIPITTVASESSFSIGSRVLKKYRNRLLSKNVEALICTRNWLHAFNNDGIDDDDDDGVQEPTFSKCGSNVLNLDDD